MALESTEALFVAALYGHVSKEPLERRCEVWWSGEGLATRYGRHTFRTRDGNVLVPHNVCGRVFLSQFPATVCDDCERQIQTVERRAEDIARSKATAAAKEMRGYGGGSKAAWK